MLKVKVSVICSLIAPLNPLFIQKHKEISDKENYCVKVYELNIENFSDLDEENM